jgi:hypothetical protein
LCKLGAGKIITLHLLYFMEQHPLQFFIDLIELRKVDDLKLGFPLSYEDVTYTNEQEEYIDHWVVNKMLTGQEKVRITFSEYLSSILSKKKIDISTSIDLYLLNNLEEKAIGTFISLIINNLNDLLFQLSQYPDAVKYPVIANTLNELKTTLQRKYSVNIIAPTSIFVTPSDTVQPKLRWNAGVASLCTMFYELANDYKLEKKGISYLAASPDQLKKFILANFVDEEGDSFSETSVATYLDSRADKKAKRNRIDIDKIIPVDNGKGNK